MITTEHNLIQDRITPIPLRVLEMDDGSVWIVTSPLCIALRLNDIEKCIAQLKGHEVTLLKLHTKGVSGEHHCCDIPGAYSLIMLADPLITQAFLPWFTRKFKEILHDSTTPGNSG
jgi:prophage antirepressor-like protein